MAGFTEKWRYARMPKFPNGEDRQVADIVKDGVETLIRTPIREAYEAYIEQIIEKLQPYHERMIIYGLIKYLHDPARKQDFITEMPSASPNEVALIDLIQFINLCTYDRAITFWDTFLDGLEFTLFVQVNGTPPRRIDVIESITHFYANVCKVRGNSDKMLTFMINGIYHMTYEVVPLIEVCLVMEPNILLRSDAYPDKIPLQRSILFLLDSFKYQRAPAKVQESYQRMKLTYKFVGTAPDQRAFLFVMMASVVSLTGDNTDTSYLEMAFVILTKQRGPLWAHVYIVKKMFLPVINGDIDASSTAKRFCVLATGPVLKLYGDDMIRFTDLVVTVLINIFKQPSQSNSIKEDIVRSLICMDKKYLRHRIITLLRTWVPGALSPELREAFNEYTRT